MSQMPAVNLRRILDRRHPGPRPPLTPELQRLVERALPAALWVAAKYVRAYGPGLDWHGEVSLRLCECVGDYDPELSSPGTWAVYQAHYACRELIRREVLAKSRGKHKRKTIVLSLDRAATADGRTFAALIADRRPEPGPFSTADGLRLLKGLTADERVVAWAVFVEGRRQSEIAATLGVSQARVHQVKCSAIDRLREARGLPVRMEGERRP